MNRRKRITVLRTSFSVLGASVSAQLAVLPFLCWIDGAVSSGSLLLNLLAAPLASAIPLLSLLLLPLLLFPRLETLFLPLTSGLGSALELLRDVARLPVVREWPQYQLSKKDLLIAAVLIWTLLLVRHLFRNGISAPAAIQVTIMASLLVLLRVLSPTGVIFISVGQGDATLFISSFGPTVLVDTGPPGSEAVILPLLHHYGIRRLDLLLITHGHLDHYGATDALIEAGVVRQVCWPQDGQQEGSNPDRSEEPSSGELTALKLLAEQVGCQAVEWPIGFTLRLGGAAGLTRLWPQADARLSCNNTSQILYFNQGEADMLLMGDLEKSGERRLMSLYALPDIDVLRVGHHGSDTSTSRLLLQSTRPETAIISVGRNSYGHPHATVVESLQEAGCNVLRTDQDGAQRMLAVAGTWYRLRRPGQED